uniref:Uncharacterized protein n=1 Tax=Panagrellus redivivus TaxID=6233 RepID=A0A7E4WE26_PANRE
MVFGYTAALSGKHYIELITPKFQVPMLQDLIKCLEPFDTMNIMFFYQTGSIDFYYYRAYGELEMYERDHYHEIPRPYSIHLNSLVCLCGLPGNAFVPRYYVLPQIPINGDAYGYDELTLCRNKNEGDVTYDFYSEAIYKMPRSIYTLRENDEPHGDECFDKYGLPTNQYPYQKTCMYVATAVYHNVTEKRDVKIFSGPFFTRGLFSPHAELIDILGIKEIKKYNHHPAFLFLTQTVFYKHWSSAFALKIQKPKQKHTPCQGFHFSNNGSALFSVICICEGGGSDETCTKIKESYKAGKKICAFNGKGDPSMFFKEQCSFQIHVDGSKTHHRLSNEDKCTHLSRTFKHDSNRCEFFDTFDKNHVKTPAFELTYCCKEDMCNFYEYHNDIADGKSFEIKCKYSRSYAAKQSKSCAFAMILVDGKINLMLVNHFHDLWSPMPSNHRITVNVSEYFQDNQNIIVAESGIVHIDQVEEDLGCNVKLSPEKFYGFILVGCGTNECDNELLDHVNTEEFSKAYFKVKEAFTCDQGTLQIHPKKFQNTTRVSALACIVNVNIDAEGDTVNATITTSDLKAKLNDSENCAGNLQKKDESTYSCWFATSNHPPNVTAMIENLLKKKEEIEESNLKKDTSTYPDACERKGLRRYKRRNACQPGHKGCFIVTDALTMSNEVKEADDDDTVGEENVYESCIGEIDMRIKDGDHVEELTDALLCNTKDTTDECFYVNRGNKYSLVCCCTTQELHLKPIYSGQISLHRCNTPVDSQFEQFNKRLKRVGEFRDKTGEEKDEEDAEDDD